MRRPAEIVAITAGWLLLASTSTRSARCPAAIVPRSVEADGGRRRLRDQAPCLGERRSTELGEPERREQRRRIVVVGGEDRAPAAPHHFGRVGPAGVAAAAHDVRARRTSAGRLPRPRRRRSPRWWGIRRRGSRARDNPRAAPGWCRRATAAARCGGARPRRAARSRPAPRCRAVPRRATQRVECLAREAGALDHLADLVRPLLG